MANEILTPKSLSHNAITQLAELLENNFQYHRNDDGIIQYKFVNKLKRVVGLGFTAVMVDGLYLSTHRPDFNQFLDYFSTNAEHDSIAPVSLVAAKIMDTAAYLFFNPNLCQDHYKAFAKTLAGVVKSGLLDSAEKSEESERLIQLMIRRNY